MIRNVVWSCAVLLVLVSPTFAAPIQLDFGMPGSPVQSGWTQITTAGSYTGANPFDLGGGVTAAFYTPGELQDRQRDTTVPMNGLGYDDVLIDFIRFDNAGPAPDRSFLIKGLADGQYNVTLYCFDGDYGLDYHLTPVVNGTTLTIGPRNGHDGDMNYARATALVTLSSGPSANVITIIDPTDHGAEGHGLLLNGVVIAPVTAVPEPATMLLLGTGALAGLGYLRRRGMR